eukprot:PhM_4_TR7266/c0_g1_i1/m.39279
MVRVVAVYPSFGGGKMCSALTQIGLRPYTLNSLLTRHILTHPAVFVRAITTATAPKGADNNKEVAPEPVDFGPVFQGQYDSVVGAPCSAVWQQIAEQYPKSIVVIERPRDDLSPTIKLAVSATRRAAKFASPVKELGQLLDHVEKQHDAAQRDFDAFVAEVEKVVPAHRLVVLTEENNSWEPIIKALGCPEPPSAYPNHSPDMGILTNLTKRMNVMYYSALIMYGSGVLLFAVIAIATMQQQANSTAPNNQTYTTPGAPVPPPEVK